ncbi:MAG: histidine phosphatase family protein [Candidatus Micrarchaeota archaeon]|nr:histidine phosphatase family protein [Candidatus Micrarchaeota archaeon]
MNQIWLIRHGEAFDDVNGTFGGWADDEPTKKAMTEAEKVVEQLSELPIELIISSPLKRALKPAQLFAFKLNVPLEVSGEFKEMNRYGFLTGVSKEDAKQKYPELIEGLKHYAFSIPGGESYNQLRSRILAGFEKIKQNGKNTLVVSHGAAIKCLLREKATPIERDLRDFEIIHMRELSTGLK